MRKEGVVIQKVVCQAFPNNFLTEYCAENMSQEVYLEKMWYIIKKWEVA
jgi:hypothetical protein